MNQIALLTPVFVLILWTFTIFLIMAYGRARFMKDPQDAAHTKDLKGTLKEQPIAFYVVTLATALINIIDPLIIQLAWVFVILRIIHSLVQLTFNLVLLRFTILCCGSL